MAVLWEVLTILPWMLSGGTIRTLQQGPRGILPGVRLAAGRIPAWTLGWHLFQQLPRIGRFVSWRRSQWFRFLALQELSGFQAGETSWGVRGAGGGKRGEASRPAAGIQLHGLSELRYLLLSGVRLFPGAAHSG